MAAPQGAYKRHINTLRRPPTVLPGSRGDGVDGSDDPDDDGGHDDHDSDDENDDDDDDDEMIMMRPLELLRPVKPVKTVREKQNTRCSQTLGANMGSHTLKQHRGAMTKASPPSPKRRW